MSQNKYASFKSWSESVGILGLENIDYPHMFGTGKEKYPGIVAKRDVKDSEAILAVPFDQLISVRRISDELKELMNYCPELFVESADYEQL